MPRGIEIKTRGFFFLALVLTAHQKSRSAVQETSDSGDKTSVEKAGDLRRNFSRLWRIKHAAHHKVLS